MAAPTYTVQKAIGELRRRVDSFADGMFTESEYDQLLMRHVVSNAAATYTFRNIGAGYFKADLFGVAMHTPTFTGADDYHYLINALGTIRALTAIRQVATVTTTATGEKLETHLTNSAGDFDGTLLTAVLIGDIAIHSQTGAVAEVTGVADALLTTRPLTYGASWVTGSTYLIGRPTASDTTATYNVSALTVGIDAAEIEVLEQVYQHRALYMDRSVGGASESPSISLPGLRQLISDKRGVKYVHA